MPTLVSITVLFSLFGGGEARVVIGYWLLIIYYWLLAFRR